MITNITPRIEEEVLTKLSLLKSESVQLENIIVENIMKNILNH